MFIVAARYPALVKKLILVSSGVFEAKYAARIDAERLNRLSEVNRAEFLKAAAIVDDPDAMNRDISMAKLGELAAKADTYDALPPHPHEMPEGFGVSAETFRKVMPEALKLRASGRLLTMGKRVNCPVVAVHGDYDTSPSDGVKVPLSRVLKAFKFVLLERCGHEPWTERYARDKFFRVLKEEIADGFD